MAALLWRREPRNATQEAPVRWVRGSHLGDRPSNFNPGFNLRFAINLLLQYLFSIVRTCIRCIQLLFELAIGDSMYKLYYYTINGLAAQAAQH